MSVNKRNFTLPKFYLSVSENSINSIYRGATCIYNGILCIEELTQSFCRRKMMNSAKGDVFFFNDIQIRDGDKKRKHRKNCKCSPDHYLIVNH